MREIRHELLVEPLGQGRVVLLNSNGGARECQAGADDAVKELWLS